MLDYDQIDFRAPLALRKLLVDFSLHCLYYRPDNLYQFAAYYFQRQVELQQARKTSGKHDSGSATWIKSPFDDSNTSTTTSDSHYNQSAVNIDKSIRGQGSINDTNGGQDDHLMWIFHCFVHKDSKQAFYDVMYDSIFNHEFAMAHSMNGFVSPRMKDAPFNRSTRAIYHGCFPMPTNIHGLTPIERNEQDDSRSFSVDFDLGNLQHENRIINSCTGITEQKGEEVIISNSTDNPSKEIYPANSEKNSMEESDLNKLNNEAMIDQGQQISTQHLSVIDVIQEKNPVQAFHKIDNQDRIEIQAEHHQDISPSDNQNHHHSSLNNNPNASKRQQNKDQGENPVKVEITNAIQPTAVHECIDDPRSEINDLGKNQDFSNTATDRLPSVIDKEKVLTSSPIKKENESSAAKDNLPINSDSKIQDKDVVMAGLDNTTIVEVDEQTEKSQFSQLEKRLKNRSKRGNSTLNNNHSQQNFSKGNHTSDKTVQQDRIKTKISRSMVSQSDSKDLDEKKKGASTKSGGTLGQKGRQNHSSQQAYSKLGKTNTDQDMRNTVLHGNTKRISHDRRKDAKDKGSIKHLTNKVQDKDQEKKSTGISQPTHKAKRNSSQIDQPSVHDNLLKQTPNKSRDSIRSNPKHPVTSGKLKTKGSLSRLDKKDQDKSHAVKSITTSEHARKDNSSHLSQGSNSSVDKNHLDQTSSKTVDVNRKLAREDEISEVDANRPVKCLDRKDRHKSPGKNPPSISEDTCKDSDSLSYSMYPIPDQNLLDPTIVINGKTNQETNKQIDTNNSTNQLDKLDLHQSHRIEWSSISQHTCKDDGNLSEDRKNVNDSEVIDPVQDKSSTDQTLSQIIHIDSKTESRDTNKEIVTNQSSVNTTNFSNQDTSEDKTTLAMTATLSKTNKENNPVLRVDPAANKTNTDNTTYISNEIDNQDISKQTGLCQRVTKSQDQAKEKPNGKSSTVLHQTDNVSKDASQIVDLAMDKKNNDRNSSRIIHIESKIENLDSNKEMMINNSATSPISEFDKEIQEVDEEKAKVILVGIVSMTDKQNSNDSHGIKPGMDNPGQVDSKAENLDSNQEMIIKSVGSPIPDLNKKVQEDGEEITIAVSSTVLSVTDEKNTDSHTVNPEMDKKNPGHVDITMENLDSSKETTNDAVASLVSVLDQNIQDAGKERTKSVPDVSGEKNNILSRKVEPTTRDRNDLGHIDSKIENLDSSKEMINKSVVNPISELVKKTQQKSEERRKAILSTIVNVTDKQTSNSSQEVNTIMEKNSLDRVNRKTESLGNSKEMISTSLANPIFEQDKQTLEESEEKMKVKSSVISGITNEQDDNVSHTVHPTMDISSLGQALSEKSHIDKMTENRESSRKLKSKHLISMPITQPEKKMQEGDVEPMKAIASAKLRMTDKKGGHHFQSAHVTLNNSDPNHINSKIEYQQRSKDLKINRSAATQPDNKNQRESQEETKAKWSAFQWHKVFAKLMKQKQANSKFDSSSTSTTIDPSMQGFVNVAKDEDSDSRSDGFKKNPMTNRQTDPRKEGKRQILSLGHGIQQINQGNSKGLVGQNDRDNTTKKVPGAKKSQKPSLSNAPKNAHVGNKITNMLNLHDNSTIEKERKIGNSLHISKKDEVEEGQVEKVDKKINDGELRIDCIPTLSGDQTKVALEDKTNLFMRLQTVTPSSRHFDVDNAKDDLQNKTIQEHPFRDSIVSSNTKSSHQRDLTLVNDMHCRSNTEDSQNNPIHREIPQKDSDLNSNNSLDVDDNQKKMISENHYTLEIDKPTGCLSNVDDLQGDPIEKETTQGDSELKSKSLMSPKSCLDMEHNQKQMFSENDCSMKIDTPGDCYSNMDDLRSDPVALIQRDSALKSDPFPYVKNSSNINENHNGIVSKNNDNTTGKLQVVVPRNDDKDDPIQIEKSSQENDNEVSCNMATGKNANYRKNDVTHNRQHSVLQAASKKSIHKDKDESGDKAVIRRTKEMEDNNNDSLHATDELKMRTSKSDLLSHPTNQVNPAKSNTISKATKSRHDVGAYILQGMNELGKSSKKHHSNKKDLPTSNDTTDGHLADKCKPKLFKKRLPQPPYSSSQQGHHSSGPALNTPRKSLEISWQPLALPTYHPNSSNDHKIVKKELQEKIDIQKAYQGVIPVKQFHQPMARNYRSKSDTFIHGNIIPLLSKNISQPATSEMVEKVPSYSQMLRYIKEKLTKVQDSASTDRPGAGQLNVAKDGTGEQNGSDGEKEEIPHKSETYQLTTSSSSNDIHSLEMNEHDRTIAACDLAIMDDSRRCLTIPAFWQHLQSPLEPQAHQKLASKVDDNRYQYIDAFDNNTIHETDADLANVADQKQIQSPLIHPSNKSLESKLTENQLVETQLQDTITNQPGLTINHGQHHTASLANQQQIQFPLVYEVNASLASKVIENQEQEIQHYDAIKNQAELNVIHASNNQSHPASLPDQEQRPSPLIHRSNASLASKITENPLHKTQHHNIIKNQSEIKVMLVGDSQHHPADLAGQLQVQSSLIHQASEEIVNEIDTNLLQESQQFDALHNQTELKKNIATNANSITSHDFGKVLNSDNQPLTVAVKQEINTNKDDFDDEKSTYEEEISSKLESGDQHIRTAPSHHDNMGSFHDQSQPEIEIEKVSSEEEEIKCAKANQDLNVEKSPNTCDYSSRKSTYSDCDGSDVGLNLKLQSRHLDTLRQKDAMPSQDDAADSSYGDLKLEAVIEDCPCEKGQSNIPNSTLDFMTENCSDNDCIQQSISSRGKITKDSNDQQISTPILSKQEFRNVDVNQPKINLFEGKKDSPNDGVFSMVDDINKIQVKDHSNSLKRQVGENNNICFNNDDTGKLQSLNQEIDNHSGSLKNQLIDDSSNINSVANTSTENLKSFDQEMDDKVEGKSTKNAEKKRHHRSSKRKGDKKHHKKHRKAKTSHSRSKRSNTLDSIIEEDEEHAEQELQPIHYHKEPNHEVAKLIGKLICNQDIDEDSDADQDIETIVYDEEIFYPLITTLVHKYEDIVENKLDHLSQQNQEIIQEQYQSLKGILTAADRCWSAYHSGSDFEVLENVRQLKSSLIDLIEENYIHEAGLTILTEAIGESRVPKACTIL